ncbi:MAG: hypothetical protein Q4B73_10365 [Lachnospiraceae bacterium]|nr:hypothetical protein [Lachnospiraceae bacterium]
MKAMLKKLSLIILPVMLLFGASPVAVLADNSEVVTLSGTIGAMQIDEGVKKVILNGVTQSEDGELGILGDVVVEIAGGTQNKLTAIGLHGNAEFTGGGELETLAILHMGKMLVFNHTGMITIPSGSLCSMAGDIVFNSGTVRTGAADETQFPLLATEGNITVNGGELITAGISGSVFAGGTVNLEGGKVEAYATDGAAFTAGKGEPGSIIISESFSLENNMYAAEGPSTDEGVTVSTIVNANGETVPYVTGEGPEATDRIKESNEKLEAVMYQEPADDENGSADGTNSNGENGADGNGTASDAEKAENKAQARRQLSPVLLVVICLAAAAVIAGVGVSMSSGKKSRKKGSGKKGSGKKHS